MPNDDDYQLAVDDERNRRQLEGGDYPYTNESRILIPIPNVLHNYTTYTYILSLHALTVDDYNGLLEGNYTPRNVLISSGGKRGQDFQRHPEWNEDFYFERLNLNTVIGINARGKGSNVVSLEFDIIEPYGLTLLDRLVRTAESLKVQNYMQIPYLLSVDFYGFDDETFSPNLIPNTQRRIPIKLLKIDMSFKESGATYHINAVPYNHTAFLDSASTVPMAVKLRGENRGKGILLSSLLSTNDSEVQNIVQSGAERADSIKNQARSDIQNAAHASEFFDQQTINQAASKINFDASKKIHQVEFGPAGLGTLLNAYYQYLAKIDYGSDAVPPYKFNFYLMDNDQTQDSLVNSVVYKKELIAYNSQLSDLIKKNTRLSDAQQQVGAQVQKDTDGIDIPYPKGYSIQEIISQLLKCTDYFRDQIKIKNEIDDDNPLIFFKITPKLRLGPYIKEKEDYQKIIDIGIIPYKSFGNRLPFAPSGVPTLKDCVKEYNYYFTGKNVDIIDLKVEFNTAYYTQYTFNPDRYTKGAAQVSSKTGESKKTSIKNDGTSRYFITTKQPVPSMSSGSNLIQTDEIGTRVNDLVNNLYSSSKADMLSVDVTILGDPSFIQEQEFSYTFDRLENISEDDSRLTKTGSLVVNNGELLVKLNFRVPEDIDTDTGFHTIQGQSRLGDSIFTGIYKVLTLDNIFERGTFTQRLKLVRVFNDFTSKMDPEQKNTTRENTAANNNQTNVVGGNATPSVTTKVDETSADVLRAEQEALVDTEASTPPTSL